MVNNIFRSFLWKAFYGRNKGEIVDEQEDELESVRLIETSDVKYIWTDDVPRMGGFEFDEEEDSRNHRYWSPIR